VSRQSAGTVASEMGDWAEAEAHLEQGLDLARAIGAKRFQAMILCRQARVLTATARGPEARAALDQALALCREAGLNFAGPWALGLIAELAEEPAERDRALAEGEAVLRAGSPGHSHFIFYNHAMAAMLAAADWPRFEYYTSALADYTRDEPLPYSDYHLAMFRALAAQAQGARDPALQAELRRLRDEAARIGMKPVLPQLDAALAGGW